MKEYYVNKAQWKVLYTREDGQPRLADKCSSPSEADAIKKALERKGAKGVFITEEIDVEVIG
jgi:hypothetical protein